MKRISVLMITVGLVALFADSAMAAHSQRSGVFRCARCHVPHGAGQVDPAQAGSGSATPTGLDMRSVPLWSTERTKDELKYTYNVYTSPTFDALHTDISTPTGASKLCLGCHDGSSNPYTGKANVSTARRVFTNNNSTPTLDGSGKAMTNNSLTRSHPVSFTYSMAATGNAGLKAAGDTVSYTTTPDAPAVPGTTVTGKLSDLMLDGNGQMQCTSCHNVHASGTGEDMLKVSYIVGTNDAALCRICHNK